MTKTTGNFTDFVSFSRASGGTYLDRDGLIKTAATNVPRVEYDASGNRKGLLIEEARTNLVPYSQDFTGTGWVVTVSGTGTYTMTPNYAVSPDGTMTATRIQASLNGGTTTSDFVMLARNATPAVQNTSTYVKSLSGSPTLSISGFSSLTNHVTVSTEWDRVSLTDTAGTGNQIRTFLLRGAQVPTHTDTVDVLIWGAQLEVGAFPTSYIPTSGATATRAADICSIATSAFGYNQGTGTIVVDVADFQFGSSGYPRAMELGNSSNTGERINIYLAGGLSEYRADVVTASATQAYLLLTTAAASPLVPAKAALAYKTNDVAAAYGGIITGTDTTANITGTSYPRDTLKIGGPSSPNGHIKSIAYYPRRLTNAQIQALTA